MTEWNPKLGDDQQPVTYEEMATAIATWLQSRSGALHEQYMADGDLLNIARRLPKLPPRYDRYALQLLFPYTEADWKALCAAYGNACLRCGSTENIVKDHIMPLSLGGRDSITNLQPLCNTCNFIHKGNRFIDYRPEARESVYLEHPKERWRV